MPSLSGLDKPAGPAYRPTMPSASGSRRLELRVGLLIVAGLVATVVIIMASDRFTWDTSYRVVAYLENASGLHTGSRVQLDGLDIGKIASLSPTADSRGSIKVLLEIEDQHRIPKDSTLQVDASGFFGDSFLSFTGLGDIKQTLAIDGTAAVKAKRGFYAEAGQRALVIMSGLSDLLDERMRENSRRLVQNAADLAAEGVHLAKDLREQSQRAGELMVELKSLNADLRREVATLGNRTGESLRSVDRTLAGIDKGVANLGQQAEQVALQAVVTMRRVDGLAAEGEAVIAANRADLRGTLARLPDVTRRLDELLAGLQSGRGVAGQLLVSQELAKDLNDISTNLTVTSRLILEHPESLVFGTDPEEAAAARAFRLRLQQRRAFQEGWFAPVPMPVPTPVPKPAAGGK